MRVLLFAAAIFTFALLATVIAGLWRIVNYPSPTAAIRVIALPLWPQGFGQAWMGRFIVMGRKNDEDVIQRLFLHESRHIAQQRAAGNLRWLFRYLTSRRWRLRYELEAYAQNVAWHWRHGRRMWDNDTTVTRYYAATIRSRLYFGLDKIASEDEVDRALMLLAEYVTGLRRIP